MNRKFGSLGLMMVMGTVIALSYQNCSKINVTDLSEADQIKQGLPVKGPETNSENTRCVQEARENGEKWWVGDGTERDVLACAVGTGSQLKVYEKQIRMVCAAGTVRTTGETQRIDTGVIEGSCDLSCGNHRNNELWWVEVKPSTETVACPTSKTDSSTSVYKNEVQYKCLNAQAMVTGETRKTILEETGCPALTFNNQDKIATLAYEDTLLVDSDSDYNDFVANIEVQETYNSLAQLTKIQIAYTPKMKVSGDPSKFILVFDGQVRGRDGFKSNVKDFKSEQMFVGSANIEFKLTTKDGTVLSHEKNIPKTKDLIVFADTKKAVQQEQRAVLTITGFDSAQNTLASRDGGLSIKRYRTVLFVNGKYDLDLSDINPTMFDTKNQPLAIFVPVGWRAPQEGQNIRDPYPLFESHAQYLFSGKDLSKEPQASKEWFLTLKDPLKVY